MLTDEQYLLLERKSEHGTNSAPLLISIMSSKTGIDAKYTEALIAEAARYVVATLT